MLAIVQLSPASALTKTTWMVKVFHHGLYIHKVLHYQRSTVLLEIRTLLLFFGIAPAPRFGLLETPVIFLASVHSKLCVINFPRV